MNALLVTSRVTFVPENYARFVEGMAHNPHVKAVLFLENRDLKTLAMGAGFWATRLAAGIGAQLVRNSVASLRDPREKIFIKNSKQVFKAEQINCPSSIDLLKNFDLVINARTRYIFKPETLKAPKIGCINIHHGMLPNQRGLFCDLWALADKRPAGFTIHQMTQKLDDGAILECCEVAPHNNFITHTLESSMIELKAMTAVLDRIAKSASLDGVANIRTPETRYFKNPTLSELKHFRRKGLSI